MQGLIIDTSTDLILLGLTKGESLLGSEFLSGGKNTSATLFPHLKDFCPLSSLSYIAVGIGPGSYMGIRTAATVAQTLAYALDLPLINFPSPLAFLPSTIQAPFTFVAGAKMDNLYLMDGTLNEGSLIDLSPPQLISKKEFSPPQEKIIIGPGYLSPVPNLDWVVKHSYIHYMKGDFSSPFSLPLTYLPPSIKIGH